MLLLYEHMFVVIRFYLVNLYAYDFVGQFTRSCSFNHMHAMCRLECKRLFKVIRPCHLFLNKDATCGKPMIGILK